jgi:hypothetical protein
MYVCMYVSIRVSMYVSISVSMYVCMYVCMMYSCMYVCMYPCGYKIFKLCMHKYEVWMYGCMDVNCGYLSDIITIRFMCGCGSR